MAKIVFCLLFKSNYQS